MKLFKRNSLQVLFIKMSATLIVVISIMMGCDKTDNAAPPVTAVSDFVLTNGKIYTVDSKQPWAEAIAVKGGEIVFVGSSEGAEKFVGADTHVADLEGRMVLPGMIDTHLHAIAGAVAASGVWVADIPDVDGVLAAISEYAEAHPENDVIFGWGYGLALFGPEGPSKELLDKAVPDRPAYIIRGDGHSAWANSKALELAGIDRNTPDPAPPAGVFGRDADGNPNGAVNGSPASIWMVDHLPGVVTPESVRASATPMLNAIAEEGITAIFDAGAAFATDASFQTLVDMDNAGELPLRYFAGHYINAAYQAEGAIERLKELNRNYQSPNLSIIALKITTDGVVENRKAAVWEPYNDGTGTGVLNFSPEEVIRMSVDAAREGYDVYMHTLGDRAVSLGLDAAEAVRKNGFNETHITLSHAQLVAEKDFPRFKAADVFINSTGGWWYFFDVEEEEVALGDRVNHEYPYRYMVDDGVSFVQGSDFPADPRINPFVHIEGSVTRHYYEYPASIKIKNPTNRLSVKEAVESYTINGAKMLHMEDKIGSLEVGKLADLIVVNQNIMEIEPGQIHQTQVLMTMMGGKVWHDIIFGWGDSKDDLMPDAEGVLPSPVPDVVLNH
jgi:predicted amidohydrolase YtcJ